MPNIYILKLAHAQKIARLFYKMVLKTLLLVDGHTSQKKTHNTNGQLVHNSAKKCLFQALTTVSGSSSAEECNTDTIAY